MSRNTSAESAAEKPQKDAPAPAAAPAQPAAPAPAPETVSATEKATEELPEIQVYVTPEGGDDLTSIDDVEDDPDTIVDPDDPEWAYDDDSDNAKLLDAKTEEAAK